MANRLKWALFTCDDVTVKLFRREAHWALVRIKRSLLTEQPITALDNNLAPPIRLEDSQR